MTVNKRYECLVGMGNVFIKGYEYELIRKYMYGNIMYYDLLNHWGTEIGVYEEMFKRDFKLIDDFGFSIKIK